MKNKYANIFEVLDNYFGDYDYPPFDVLSNGEIKELRQHIITFYQYFGVAEPGDYQTRLFLGSFLSTPPLDIHSSPYISSALLIANSVTLIDPLHYWFCDEQYKRERLMSAPSGWKRPETILTKSNQKKTILRPDYKTTRMYLKYIQDWLMYIRPLVDSGIIILVPSEQIVLNKLSHIDVLSRQIKNEFPSLVDLSSKFLPEDITVEDNSKGLFIFANGDKKFQIEKHLHRGLFQFAKDVILSNETGSLYTAPFKWEQFLGKTTFSTFSPSNSEAKLIEAISNLQLPILANLTPETIKIIHQDSSYPEFRNGLSTVLRNINEEFGSQNFVQEVHQIEKDILLPKIQKINKEVKSSKFQRISKAFQEGVFTFTQTFVSNTISGQDISSNLASSGINSGLALIKELIQKKELTNDKRIWAQLLPNSEDINLYGSPLQFKQTNGKGWNIEDIPSMSIAISSGIMKMPIYTNSNKHN